MQNFDCSKYNNTFVIAFIKIMVHCALSKMNLLT